MAKKNGDEPTQETPAGAEIPIPSRKDVFRDLGLEVLIAHGFTVWDVIPVYTQRYGGLDNAEKRAEHEVLIVAERVSG